MRYQAIMCLISLAICCTSPPKKPTDLTEHWYDLEERAVKESGIIEEVEHTWDNHPWVGIYERGHIFDGATLYMASRSGFLYISSIDIGPNTNDLLSGKVVFKNNMLHLVAKDASGNPVVNTSFHNDYMALDLCVVKWGARTYLVPPDNMYLFCRDVQSGAEPRDHWEGRWLLKRYDWLVRVSGIPDVPSQYKAQCMKK